MKTFYLVLGLFFIVGSLVEYYITRKEDKEYYSLRDFRSSLYLMLTGMVIDLVVKIAAVALLLKLYDHSLLKLGYDWWVWVLCYVLWDLVFYLKHYLEHNVRFMWAIHVNHHSSRYMNLSTSLRSGIFKSAYRYFFWAVPVFIGFPVPVFLVLYGLGKLWAFFSHSQKLGTWGVLEKLTITPTHHLLHHSYNNNHLNKNFGETFLLWDKLFGTFAIAKEPLKYGIEEQIDHSDFKQVVFHEFEHMIRDFKKADTFKAKMKVVFGKP